MKRLLILAMLAVPLAAQTTRPASDFELEQMERQVARSHDFLSQLSGHMNLGDLHATRSESSIARREYATAYDIAAKERVEARRASSMTRYATATSYAALAKAKLGDEARAFGLLEESLRYSSDSAKTWNLYASAMSSLRLPRKAAAAARNAVTIASDEVQRSPTVGNRLDLAIYQYSLASSLIEAGDETQSEQLLREAVASLRSSAFASLRDEAARREAFEIYSSARGDEAAYLSIRNRAQLKLGALYESRGDSERAREQYRNVLADRSDDPTALAAMARLSSASQDRQRYFAEAFDANPFSMTLVREYQRWLESAPARTDSDDSTGGRVRLALEQLHRGENRAARATLDALLQRFPDNDTLRSLRSMTEPQVASAPTFLGGGATKVKPTAAELRQLLALLAEDRLTPEQRVALDRLVFVSDSLEGVPFRLSEPAPLPPAPLTYRILGATVENGADALLIEVLR